MIIQWDIRVPLEESILHQLQLAADLAESVEQVSLPCSVSVCLCDDEYIAAINQQFRSVSKSTDVLSFPTVLYPNGKTARLCDKLIRREWDDETQACFLGEIIISVPHIYAQASEFSHSETREAVYLLVHGLFHLFGYDHLEDLDKELMRTMEEKVLSSLDLGRKHDLSPEDRNLIRLATEAMAFSYSPYSSFPVGAALHCTDGSIYLGCNVENASFGLSNCAERTAVFKAVSEGKKQFDAIAISATKAAWPCGACRQVLNEFAVPGFRVLIAYDNIVEERMLEELLPEGFGPNSL